MIEHYTCTVCDAEFTTLDIKDRGMTLIAEYRDADLYRDPTTQLVHCLRPDSYLGKASRAAAEGAAEAESAVAADGPTEAATFRTEYDQDQGDPDSDPDTVPMID